MSEEELIAAIKVEWFKTWFLWNQIWYVESGSRKLAHLVTPRGHNLRSALEAAGVCLPGDLISQTQIFCEAHAKLRDNAK